MTNTKPLTDECLEKMALETIDTISTRLVETTSEDGGSIEVNASLFLNVLREVQKRRQADTPPVHPTVASEQLDDETLQEMIEFRRSTFEYHSKEGNKVQAIIHGTTLSALRELQERRKASAEPVAYMATDSDGGIEYNGQDQFSSGCGKSTPLYAAPPVPVVPEE